MGTLHLHGYTDAKNVKCRSIIRYPVITRVHPKKHCFYANVNVAVVARSWTSLTPFILAVVPTLLQRIA